MRPRIERAALVDAVNDAWLVIGALAATALLLIPIVRRPCEGTTGVANALIT